MAIMEANRMLRGVPDDSKWICEEAIGFITDVSTKVNQLDGTDTLRSRLARSHFLAGMTLIGEGRRADAKIQFNACVETEFYFLNEYQWARAFLAQLERDETWPHRIKGPDFMQTVAGNLARMSSGGSTQRP